MKILKKLLYFLPIIILLSIFSAISVSAADYTEGYYTYSVSNGEATITDVNTSISGNITIPSTLGGYPVTGIGSSAFAYCSGVTDVTIPNGVTYVGSRSFYSCSNLVSATIPPSLQLFNSEAFRGCSALKTVNISDLSAWCESDFIVNNSNAGSNPLGYGGTLYLNNTPVSGNLIIPDGTKKIGDYVFFGYDNFTSITIPQSVESFGHQTFTNCRSLETIYISDLRQWCEFDFSEDIDNPLYYAQNLYLNGAPVSGDLIIPEGISSIGACAFYYNEGITSIVIPDSVTSIGQYAFYGCSNIKKLDIGSGIQSVGDYAFSYPSVLEQVNIHDLRVWCENDFGGKGSAVLLLNGEPIEGRLEIPSGTTKIQENAFEDCKAITEVIIPTSVTQIGKWAFASCYGISNVEIHGSPSIGNAAFGWIGTSASEKTKICFYDQPQSIHDSEYTIYDDVEIWCYADNSIVKNYANSYGRDIHYFPCEGSCSYSETVAPAYLKSEGNCTTKSVYYQSCAVCLNASDTLTFEGEVVHSFTEQTVDSALLNEATCTQAAEYYLSCDCGATHPTQTFTYGEPLGHSYDNACDDICNHCTFAREAPHNIETIYDYNSTYHWYPCLSCGLKFSYEAHVYDDNSDSTCDPCGFERTVLIVSYDANGGENAPAISYVPLGSIAIVPSDIPTKESFVFVGWTTIPNGTVEYEVEDTLNLTESITLYAVWKAECQECDGTGQTYTTRTCTSCASGYVYSSSCYYCYGRGKYSTGDMSCSNCYGSGQVKDPYGSGKYVNCLMCGGDGLVPDYQTCYHCRSKCTICNGSAKITDYFDCENCDALGYYDSFDVYYDANGGSGAPSSQSMGGKNDVLSDVIPLREGFVFVGWNTLVDNNAIYQPGDIYCGGTVTFYAMWTPACPSCAGAGCFTQGEVCGSCNGNGTYSVTVKTCNSCSGTHIITHVTGYGTISYCSNCGSSSIKTSTQTKTCNNCTNGTVNSTYECEDCEGKGYLQVSPKALSFSDCKVVLLKIEGMEYSIDGISWQDSNVFTELLPGTGYSFYQRMKATENAPFGVISAPLLLRTDKADNEDTPSTPIAVEITSESIRLDLIDGCEYSFDGVNWQIEPLFTGLNCATNYTLYARFAETDTHYASQTVSYTVVRTEKGTVSAPSIPELLAVGRDRVILQKIDGYEYSIDGISWQSSNIFLNLESKTNYFFYCRFAETDRYYASSSSEALIVKTLSESEICNHSFIVEDNTYIKSEATCTSPAIYYKSCIACGEKGSETFEQGPTLTHSYTRKVTTETYKLSSADCDSKAVYYYCCATCDAMGTSTYEHGEVLEHIDENTDHICDRNCGKTDMETHEDGDDANHACDYCGGTVEGDICVDVAPKNHICDECEAILSSCEEGTTLDGKCDYCGNPVDHTHVDTNKDHVCDYDDCAASVGTHTDTEPKDHKCDDYGNDCTADKSAFGTHADGDDANHTCDYCGDTVDGDVCVDTDKNHICDECGANEIGTHADSSTDNDHICDYGCEAVLEPCSDRANDGNHACDVCGKADVTEHTYGNATCEAPATCSECGATTGNALGHIDTNTDHICDHNCGKMDMETHADGNDADHTCDYCGGAVDGEICVDTTPKNHICDECGEQLSNCSDGTTVDGKCDYCGNPVDHTHVDTNKDHVCDYDDCVASVGTHTDTEPKDHKCDGYGDDCSADKSAFGIHADGDDNNHTCDYCNGAVDGENCHDVNTDTDHKCDECGADNVTEHKDGNDNNHLCDNGCGKIADDGCHGGTATCTSKAVCEECNLTYGDFGAHAYGDLFEAVAEKHTATELLPSVAAHYHCSVCGKYFTAAKVETTLEALTGETPSHSYGDWQTNDDKHWKECSCGDRKDSSAHIGGSATCEVKAKCSVCNAEYGELSAHTPSADDGDCTTAITCSVCGEITTAANASHTGGMATSERKAECTVCGKEYGELATHDYSTEWSKNDTHHWHECSCGDKSDEAKHSFGEWTITDEATATENGEKTRSCVCGQTETETIHATGTNGDNNDPAPEPNNDDEGLSGGAIAGIAVGSTAVVSIGGFSLFWFVIKKKSWADLLKVFKK